MGQFPSTLPEKLLPFHDFYKVRWSTPPAATILQVAGRNEDGWSVWSFFSHMQMVGNYLEMTVKNCLLEKVVQYWKLWFGIRFIYITYMYTYYNSFTATQFGVSMWSFQVVYPYSSCQWVRTPLSHPFWLVHGFPGSKMVSKILLMSKSSNIVGSNSTSLLSENNQLFGED